jgi:hypothetical protein
MIRKSGNRFSEKIVLKQIDAIKPMTAIRTFPDGDGMTDCGYT